MNKTLTPIYPVLLIDDEEAWLNSLSLTLKSSGINNVSCCSDAQKVFDILKEKDFSVLVLDLIMPHFSGEELLPEIVKHYPDMPVIILTGIDQVNIAVNCIKLGAFEYQVKVNGEGRLVDAIKRAINYGLLRRENSSLKHHFLNDCLDQPEAFSEIITTNKTMRSLFQYMEAIATTNAPILITGETGVGKELFARAIHTLSKLNGNFVPINIASLDDNVFSDTLFGHSKGAFTGAEQAREGLIVKAGGGSLFLDEIGDLSQGSQIKLLRLLQEREYLPLGSDIPKKTDIRMIFATLKDIETLKNTKQFRDDLFFRLRTHHIHVPPLRQRIDDIPILLDFFIEQGAQELDKSPPRYPEELVTLLSTYSFPGNVRELKNIIFDALSNHRSKMLSMNFFKEYIEANREEILESKSLEIFSCDTPFAHFNQLPTLKEAQSFLVKEALKRAKGNQAIAASMLGITRQALNWRLKKEGR